jgi:hypothetical protein
LSKDKLLVEADMWNPPAQPNTPPPAGVAAAEPLNLWNNIQRLKLDVEQIAPLHVHPSGTFSAQSGRA